VTSPEEKNGHAENFPARHSFWIGLAIIATTFVFAAALTWRKWPDLINDFGIQLYIPWRLAHGAVLYRDLFYLAGGPLSQYYHAALFKMFGASFLTLIISNLAVVAAMLLLIYRQFRIATDTLTATVIALAIIIVFAFAQYTGVGNYNYLTPYSHEILHSLALSILAVALLSEWLARGKFFAAPLAGFFAGLVSLDKPDIFLALMFAVAAAFALFLISRKRFNFAAKSFAAFFLAGFVPLVLFFLFFFKTENWRESLRLEFFGWHPIFVRNVVTDPFYQWSLGLDYLPDHVRQIAIQFSVVAAIVIVYAFAFRRLQSLKKTLRLAGNTFLFLLLLVGAKHFDWMNCGAALPLLCVSACIILFSEFQKTSADRAVIFPLLWSVFALILLAKQGVFPRIWHTGFGLAMPAFVGAVYFFLWRLPAWLAGKFQVPRGPMRVAAALTLAVAFWSLAAQSERFYSAKKLPVGHGADTIIAQGPDGNAVEARTMNLALDWLAKNVPPDATLAALPQGAMLNFLSRHVNPTPSLDWNPTMLAVFGQTNMLAALKKNPPGYIAVVQWTTYEFGLDYFGKEPGYGTDVMAWIKKNYETAALFGSEPLKNGLFGIKILKRLPAATSQKRIENYSIIHL
jgi:hypothetical protein